MTAHNDYKKGLDDGVDLALDAIDKCKDAPSTSIDNRVLLNGVIKDILAKHTDASKAVS